MREGSTPASVDGAELLLLAFDDRVGDVDLGNLERGPVLRFVRVLDGGGNLRVAETVGAIERLDGVGVCVDERLAVTPGALVEIGLLDAADVPDGVGVEVFVAFDVDGEHLVFPALVDRVLHGDVAGNGVGGGIRICGGAQDVDLGGHVEVALLLQEVADVVRAFVEQVVVDCAFFVDRDEQMDARLGKLCADDNDLDDGALLGGEVVIELLARAGRRFAF